VGSTVTVPRGTAHAPLCSTPVRSGMRISSHRGVPVTGNSLRSTTRAVIIECMRIVKRSVLKKFAARHPEASSPLDVWCEQIRACAWGSPVEIRRFFGANVDFVAHNRAVFNIKGNQSRLIAEINYKMKAVYIRFIGTHAAYDRVDAATIKMY
jgi:mRNA interferase HigB